MIKLLYEGNNRAIRRAVRNANQLLQSDAFYERVALLPQMLNTSMSSSEIAAILRENNQIIRVQSFWNPFSKSTKIKKSCLFMVNSYNLSCITSFAVNTIINETILSAAIKCEQLNFERTNEDEMEYPNVFPSRIGEVAEILTRKNKMSRLQSQFN